MNKHTEESDPKNPPTRATKSNPMTSWAFIAALLGTGALPCPDCGMPLAWHLWPLAVLLLAGRWIARRKTARPSKHDAPAPPDDSKTPPEA
jgi:hypothetical protein